jgi:hypothetical protein
MGTPACLLVVGAFVENCLNQLLQRALFLLFTGNAQQRLQTTI